MTMTHEDLYRAITDVLQTTPQYKQFAIITNFNLLYTLLQNKQLDAATLIIAARRLCRFV